MLPPSPTQFPQTSLYLEPVQRLDDTASADTFDDYLAFPDTVFTTFEVFRRHPDFPDIQRQFVADIEALRELSQQMVGSTYICAIDNFLSRIRDLPPAMHGYLTVLFQDTRYQLHHLVVMLRRHLSNTSESPTHDAMKRKLESALHCCLEGIDRCNEGIHSRFMAMWRRLNAADSLSYRLAEIKTQLLQAHTSESLFRLQQENHGLISQSMEIHWHNGLWNLGAKILGLPPIEDHYAPKPEYMGEELCAWFSEGVTRTVSPCIIQQKFAEQWIGQLEEILDQHPLGDWRRQPIAIGDLSPDLLSQLEAEFSDPLSALLPENDLGRIGLWSIAHPGESDEHYDLRRYRESLQGLLAQGITGSRPTPLLQLPDYGSSSRSPRTLYTTDGLFFWVQHHGHSAHSYEPWLTQPVTLADLMDVDISNLPDDVQFNLILQALAQTESAQAVFDAFTMNELARRLGRVHYWQSVAEALTSRMNSEPDFAAQLGTLMAQQNWHHRKLPNWLVKTPLLGPLLQSMTNQKLSVIALVDLLIADKELDRVAALPDLLLANLEITPSQKRQLLRLACETNRPTLFVRLLCLHYGATLFTDGTMIAPLFEFLIRHDRDDGLSYLLAQGVNIREILQSGQCLIHQAAMASPKCLRLLLQYVPEHINAVDGYGVTPLQIAANNGCAENVVTLLTTPGIDVGKCNPDGNMALHFAAASSHENCLCLLVPHSQPAHLLAKNARGEDPIALAARSGSAQSLEILASDHHAIDFQVLLGPERNNYLHFAAMSSKPDTLAYLLGLSGAPVNAFNRNQQTPLHIAVQRNNTESLSCLLKHPEIDVNRKALRGQSALHLAVSSGHTESVRLLLRHAKINVSRELLNVAQDKGYHDIVRLLMQDPRTPASSAGFTFRMPKLGRWR